MNSNHRICGVLRVTGLSLSQSDSEFHFGFCFVIIHRSRLRSFFDMHFVSAVSVYVLYLFVCWPFSLSISLSICVSDEFLNLPSTFRCRWISGFLRQTKQTNATLNRCLCCVSAHASVANELLNFMNINDSKPQLCIRCIVLLLLWMVRLENCWLNRDRLFDAIELNQFTFRCLFSLFILKWLQYFIREQRFLLVFISASRM